MLISLYMLVLMYFPIKSRKANIAFENDAILWGTNVIAKKHESYYFCGIGLIPAM